MVKIDLLRAERSRPWPVPSLRETHPLLRKANTEEQCGRPEKAIEALKQYVQSCPEDPVALNHLGDLYLRLNNTGAANGQFVKVARHYADDGFCLKAIAVWKKVLRNDPSMLDGARELGELYARQGRVAEAKQTLNFAVDEYIKRSKKRETGEVLRRLAALDPADMKVRIRLAEFCWWDGHPEKAVRAYLAIGDELVKKGHLAEALQLIEKALRSGLRSPLLLVAQARVTIAQALHVAEKAQVPSNDRPADKGGPPLRRSST